MIARLFRAGQPVRELRSIDELPTSTADDELLWVDLDRSDPDLEVVMERLGMQGAVARVRAVSARPELVTMDAVVVVSVLGLEGPPQRPRPVPLDIAAHDSMVLSAHDGPVNGLETVVEVIQGRSELGRLDAATFVSVLMDGLLAAFFEAIEDIELAVDRLDERALQAEAGDELLRSLVELRQRISSLRRALAPHRFVLSALARPDLGLATGSNDPWPAVLERFERAVQGVENARELLFGSFDVLMTRTSQRTNDIVRVLTVVSVTLLPAGVVAGVFGMNFRSQLFETDGLYLPVVLGIAAISIAILAMARIRRWI